VKRTVFMSALVMAMAVPSFADDLTCQNEECIRNSTSTAYECIRQMGVRCSVDLSGVKCTNALCGNNTGGGSPTPTPGPKAPIEVDPEWWLLP